MDMFYGTIVHEQSMFKIKSVPILRGALDCLFHMGRILRMNAFESEFHGRFRRPVVLEDSKGLL
jgi:hypothetical protein